jgi:ubiquinol oxidase
MCHAMLLETVAAVPGMVGGMLLHLKSLRRFEHSGGWIKALLEEAENERMHLMTFIELSQPKWYERAIVFTVQGVFFNAYFLAYVISPKLAHRITGYLEEEAVNSYTEFLKDIDAGKFENSPAPAIAIDYWRLPKDATLRDVVYVIRADEAHHRDINHYASDIQFKGHELKEAPAPIGYH